MFFLTSRLIQSLAALGKVYKYINTQCTIMQRKCGNEQSAVCIHDFRRYRKIGPKVHLKHLRPRIRSTLNRRPRQVDETRSRVIGPARALCVGEFAPCVSSIHLVEVIWNIASPQKSLQHVRCCFFLVDLREGAEERDATDRQ